MTKVYRRTLQKCQYKLTMKHPHLSLDWIKEQAQNLDKATLLTYADDGVIWGKIESGHLYLAPSPSPSWKVEHILEVWLFNTQTAWHLWKDARNLWQGWYLQEGEAGEWTGECYDEPHFLWGTHYEGQEGNFTQVREGERGLRQALPLTVEAAAFADGKNGYPLRMWVRHYLEADETGVLRVILSRPLNLEARRLDPEKGGRA